MGHTKIPWNLFVFVKTCVEITTSQLHTDQKPTELLRAQSAGTKKVPLHFQIQTHLGGNWWREAVECFCNLRSMQVKLADGKSLYETRFGIQFDGSVTPSSTTYKRQKSSSSNGTGVLSGLDIGYALNSGASWTGDLIIVDWQPCREVRRVGVSSQDSSSMKLESRNDRMHSFFFALMVL